MSTDPNSVDASPTKSFFVDMLTRDISVIDSLLDLCDNALGKTFELADVDPSDVVIEGRKAQPLKPYRLSLTTSQSTVRIEDNCGGISQDDARDEIFRLGRNADDRPDKGLSVYGIGMKRAFFKLADSISLRSAHGSEWFEIAFSVTQWKKEKEWTLSFTRRGSSNRPPDIPHNGTVIELKHLRPGVKELMGTKSFEKELIRRLGSTYSLFLASGLSLTLNDVKLQSGIPLVADAPIKPARKSLTIDKVKILIIAGVTPRTLTPSAATSGWFAYCNGRLVLDADKSRVSGWGENLPQWHTKFSRFVGFVLFSSKDSRALPWTTTKQGLVDDSVVFQQARQEMQLQARPVLDFLTRMYPGEVPEEGVEERAVLDQAKPIELSQVTRSDRVFKMPVRKANTRSTVNIQYKKPIAQIELARTKLGRRLSASEIGSRTFDIFIKTEAE